jgi:hypothetical protein
VKLSRLLADVVPLKGHIHVVEPSSRACFGS